MNKITYNKLVRDNVPEIIEKAGKVCNTRILNDEDYFDCLVNKLSEEMSEFLAAFSIEELADIQEVVNAIAKAKGYTLEEFDAIRKKKADKNGGFEKKILLESVNNK